MKSDIHPKYYPNAHITCACGNTFNVGSTVEAFDVEICSACHPFYTGKEKIIDTAGRVERFKRRASQIKESKGKKKDRVRKPRIERVLETKITLRRDVPAQRIEDTGKMTIRRLPPARGGAARKVKK